MGKWKDKVIVQSSSDEDMTTIATSGMIGSLEMKSSQGHKGDDSLREDKAEGIGRRQMAGGRWQMAGDRWHKA